MSTLSPQLTKAVRESRLDISREYQGLLSDLNVQQRVVNSVKLYPLRWIGGAAIAGLLTSLLGAKSSRKSASKASAPSQEITIQENKVLSKVGWMAGALEIGKVLYPVLRPVVLEFAQNFLHQTLSKKK